MRKIIFACVVCTVVGALAVSCSKNESESDETLRDRSFEAWIQVYAPNAERLDGGIYVEKIYSSEQVGALTPEDMDTWVMINYTGTAMATGDVFVTRDPEVAKHQGTFYDYTHYTPDYVPFTPYNSDYYGSDLDLIMGNYLALGHMKEGDIWRVYIPSDLAYGSSGYSYEYSGFGGQNALGTYIPVTMELELVKVVTDPETYEASLVQNYAVGELQVGLTDTISENVYIKTISPSTDTMLVKEDSIVSIYYVGRFLDGFVFDTNIEDTAAKYNLTQYATSDDQYDLLSVQVGASEDDDIATTENTVITGMNLALTNMTYGTTATVIFTSTYGYGSTGQFPTFTSDDYGNVDMGTIIPPYTPLIFDITVAPHYGDGSLLYPYTTYAIQHLLDDEVDDIWVTGYINGVVDGDYYMNWIDTLEVIEESEIRDNIMLASTTHGTKPEDCFPVYLPEGTIRDALNIPDNQGSVFRQHIKLYGNIRKYKGTRGLVDVTDYRIL